MQIVQKWLVEKTNQSVLCLLVGGLLFRGLIAFWLYPTDDEAYYYIYSLHLDWSYFDHPVMVALTTGFGPWVTGVVSQFTIRLGALICYTGSLVLLYFTSRKLFSAKAAYLTLAIATISPIFAICFGLLSLPDAPLMLFWTASLYCAADEFFRQPHLLKDESGSSHLYLPSYRFSHPGGFGRICLFKQISWFCFRLRATGFLLNKSPSSLRYGFPLDMARVRLVCDHHLPYFIVESTT